MNSKQASLIVGLSMTMFITSPVHAAVTLYDQNFEHPAAFVNDGGDVNIFNPVNELYGNQPVGFSFAQTNTVETLLITGSQAFGHGYSDPSGKAGNYALGMLSTEQNDWLGLSFNVGSNPFMNVRMVSRVLISAYLGPVCYTWSCPNVRIHSLR